MTILGQSRNHSGQKTYQHQTLHLLAHWHGIIFLHLYGREAACVHADHICSFAPFRSFLSIMEYRIYCLLLNTKDHVLHSGRPGRHPSAPSPLPTRRSFARTHSHASAAARALRRACIARRGDQAGPREAPADMRRGQRRRRRLTTTTDDVASGVDVRSRLFNAESLHLQCTTANRSREAL